LAATASRQATNRGQARHPVISSSRAASGAASWAASWTPRRPSERPASLRLTVGWSGGTGCSLRWAPVPTPPKPTTVLLVRHGRTPTTGAVLPGRKAGLHLSEAGRGQAERAAERIAGLKTAPAAVYASPLERTRETAAPIAKALGLRVRTDAGLLECDMGRWTGSSLKRLARTKEW